MAFHVAQIDATAALATQWWANKKPLIGATINGG